MLDNNPIDDELRSIFLEEMLMISSDMMNRGVPAASEDRPRPISSDACNTSEDSPQATNAGVFTTNEDEL